MSKAKGNHYLFINDTLYDVSDFVYKHPGGGVIRTMLWTENEPKDASMHFREFHYRHNQSATSQVKELLSSMPKANPELQEKAKNVRRTKVSARDINMIKDFVKLRQELEAKGFFQTSYLQVFIRLFLIAMLWVLGYYVLAHVNFCLGIYILSWAFQQCGWVQHEGGHRSLTGNVHIDGGIQFFILYVIYGGSGYFWNHQHNHHHANTQHEDYDVDLKTLPLIAFDSDMFSDTKKKKSNTTDSNSEKEKTQIETKTKENNNTKPIKKRKSWWLRHQWFTFTISNLLVFFLWKLLIHLRFELRKRHYWYLVCTFGINIGYHFSILYFLCGLNLKWTIIAYLSLSIGGLWLLLFHFTVSHTFTGTQNDKYNWVETAALHTVNVKDHWLVNIVMGLLNFQIEHHLFPQMSHSNARRAVPYVKALFKKYNLPYYECGYFQGFWMMFKNLYHVGYDLPPVRPTMIDVNKVKSL